ncbi:hypothetical protein Hanom_Chr01g00076631 [Helianthus anomalus]
MNVSANDQGPREKSRKPKPKSNTDSLATPSPMSQASGPSALAVVDPVSTDLHMDDASKCLLDGKTASSYNAMIYEVLSTLKAPNGSDISAMFLTRNSLWSDQVQNGYRLRREVVNGTKGPIPKPNEIRPRLSGASSEFTTGDTVFSSAMMLTTRRTRVRNRRHCALLLDEHGT